MWLCKDGWLPEGTVGIPLLGEVAAGRPLDMCAVDEHLHVPESLWNGRKVFALRVRGESMIDAGIHDGDYLIVEARGEAENGRTVVAEIDGCVTVKKLYRQSDGSVRLQPANPQMLPLSFCGDGVRVLGVVVGVLRKYGFAASREAPRATLH
jgi:repressor LexA